MVTITALCVASLVAPAHAGDAERGPFPTGEVLVYRVKWTWISAGTSKMSIGKVEDVGDVEGLRGQRISMQTTSSGLARQIMHVDDVATTWIDPATAGTVYYRFDKREDDKREVETLTPLQGGSVRYYRKKHTGKERTVDIKRTGTGPPLDSLSLFYYLRRVPLKLKRDVNVTVYQGDRAYPLKLTPVALQEVRVVGVGTFKAFKMKPDAASPGLFAKNGEATFWLEEKTHVLLRMVVDVKYGSVNMCLARASKSPLLSAPGGPEHKH
jgi:hypothetical protein